MVVRAQVADADLIDGGPAEAEQEEHHRHHPEHRIAELVAELEGEDLAEHRRGQAAARREADRVEKYRSSNPPSTGAKPSPGSLSASTWITVRPA